MAKERVADRIKLAGYDDLFGKDTSGQIVQKSDVEEIPLDKLNTFKNHPFRVMDDEKMYELVKSVEENGVLVPGIARKLPDGNYEIIAGHRRKRACELAGLTTMPVVVKDYSDDEATILMIDTNIQREELLPSEKAFAYRMKYEAQKHQGKAGGNTMDEIGREAGDNLKTVQRYIRLTHLVPELLELVDEKKLGFIQGVDISYLTDTEQDWVNRATGNMKSKVSLEQATLLKEYSQRNELTEAMTELILQEKSARRQITLSKKKLDRYFGEEYSDSDIEEVILSLLEDWKNKQ